MAAKMLQFLIEVLIFLVGVLSINTGMQCEAGALNFQHLVLLPRIFEIHHRRCLAQRNPDARLHARCLVLTSSLPRRVMGLSASRMSRGGGNKGENKRKGDSEMNFDEEINDMLGSSTGGTMNLDGEYAVFDVKNEMNELDQRLMAAIEADSSKLLDSLDLESGTENLNEDDDLGPKSPRKVSFTFSLYSFSTTEIFASILHSHSYNSIFEGLWYCVLSSMAATRRFAGRVWLPKAKGTKE
jgi:hypothetical protein